MSYDLGFYTKSSNPISKTSIEEYLMDLPNIWADEENVWTYQNDDTGVHCRFEYIQIEEENPEFEDHEYKGFIDTNFGFTINFIRPQFFALECFPIVEQIVEDLDLYILNFQDEGEPKKYEKSYFENQWAESNLNLSKSLFLEAELGFLELEKSNYSWKYSLNRGNLQNRFGDSIFVPGIFYIQKKNSSQVQTLCVWPEHIPFLLPQVDLILIQKSIKKLFRTKKENGLITYSHLMDQFKDNFEDEDFFKILNKTEALKIARSYNELELFTSIEEYGEIIQVDKIVNVNPKEVEGSKN